MTLKPTDLTSNEALKTLEKTLRSDLVKFELNNIQKRSWKKTNVHL